MTYTLLIITISAIYTLICWRNLRLGLYVLAASLPAYLLRISFFGIPSTLLEVMIVILVVVWLIKTRPDLLSVIPSSWRRPLLLFIATALVSVWISPNTLGALGVFKAYFVEPILVFLIASQILENKKGQKHILTALGVSGLAVSIFGIYQYVAAHPIPIPWDVERRITSLYPFPNAVGLYLGPIVTIAGAALVLIKKRTWKNTCFWTSVFVLGLLAVFFAKSEAALVAIPAAFFVAGIFLKKYRAPALIMAGIVIFTTAIGPFGPNMWQKVTLQDTSGQVRISQWEETWSLLRETPVFGAGLSGYPTALVPHHTHTEYEIFQYPHNILLNFWVEIGITGIIAVIWIIKTTGESLKQKITDPKRNWPEISAGLALIQMFIHGLVDVPYFKNDLAVLTWVLIAVIISSNHVFRQTDKK